MARSRRGRINTRDPVIRDHPLNTGRLAWWLGLPSQAGTGNLYDLMGTYHAAASGTVQWTPSGDFAAPVLDGSTIYRAPAASLGDTKDGPATWGVRFTPDAAFVSNISIYPILFARWTDTYTDYIWSQTLVAFPDGTVHADTPGGFNYHAPWTPVAGVESMLIWTWNGSRNGFAFYINGVAQSVTEDAWGPPTVSSSGAPFVLGGHPTTRQISGLLSEAFFWNRVLSAGEVATLYDQSRRGYPDLLRRTPRRALFLGTPPTLVAGSAYFVSSGPLAASSDPGILVTADAPTGGAGAGPTYQWERSVDGGSYADISGATSLDATDDSVSSGHVYRYRCKQTRGSDTVTTNVVTAQLYPGGSLSGGARRTPNLRRSR